ncbi:MAG: hypothetical protein IPH62_19840, partial [Ignavibacteriae bacterium]|nr:hypothetical protein [Ignavibacteriota bacterium]
MLTQIQLYKPRPLGRGNLTNIKLVVFILLSFGYINNSLAADSFGSGGYSHNVLLYKDSMYIAGSNKYGELNYNETGVEYRNFVKFADKISQVSANYSRTAFITKSNKLFYFGWKTGLYDNVAPTLISNNVIDVSLTSTNIYYITNKKVYEFVPKTNITMQLMLQEEPVSLATGTGHLVVLTKNGNVYTYGLNNQGQLCSNNTINKTVLTNVNYYGCNTIS